MNESVILCEGYHDRAFWAGWFVYLGCIDLGRPTSNKNETPSRQSWRDRLRRGEYGFYSKSGKLLRIYPCLGKDRIIPAAELQLKNRKLNPIARLVLNVDADLPVDAASSQRPTLSYQAVEGLMRKFGEPKTNEHGEFLLDDDATVISVVRWEASDQDLCGIPIQQTLERLVCASLIAAHPQRGPAVQSWLDSRPDGSQAGPKEFGWSHMAGWYAEFGCEAFYRQVWADTRVAAELKSRLVECGAWRIAEALAE